MNIQDVNKDELSNVMRQYYDIKIKYPSEIVLFQLGDFYEMFFEDAIVIAKELELTLTSKKAGLKERIPMCGIPLSTLNDYLKKMLVHNHVIILVKQKQNDELGQKLVSREITQIITKATHINDGVDNNYVGAISKEDDMFCLAYADIATGEMYSVCSTNYSYIEAEIINQGISEVVISFEISQKVAKSLLENGIVILNSVDVENKTQVIPEDKAQENLLKYLSYSQVGAVEQFKEFTKIKLSANMYLSPNAQKQLELFKTLDDEDEYTLLNYLNNTTTAMGKRLLKKYLVHPLVDEETIKIRQNIVEGYIQNPILLEDTTNILKNIYDFERLIGKVISGSITPRELERLKISMSVLPELYDTLPSNIFELIGQKQMNELGSLYNFLNQSLVVDAPITTKDGGFIKDGYSQGIDELKKLKENSNEWLIEFEQEEIKSTGIKNLKVKYNKIFGYFIEVTNSNLQMVPDYYIEKQTMANCKRYITEKLKEEEYKILNASEELLKLELEAYEVIKNEVKANINKLQKVSYLVATTDVLTTFSLNAINYKLVKPIFNEEGKFEIIDGRHPIVENTVDNYISNDIDLSEKEIMLITGPNMAGKSTYMRMVALHVILAQIGSFVPASKACLEVVGSLFTRIGAGDSLSKGMSTFMVEMLETKDALEHAEPNSLLIFDELGRGTSTYDGIALAQAIIKYIYENIKCKTLFSTHYHELIAYVNDIKDVQLVHVKAQEEEDGLKFYHKVMPGSISQSYGIQVASLAGLDLQIIKDAKDNYISEKSKEKQVVLKSEDKQNKKLEALIANVDLNNMTPMEGLNTLAKIKEEYDNQKK